MWRTLTIAVVLFGCNKEREDYARKSIATEVNLNARRIAQHIKAEFAETNKLPVGKVGPTPSTPCCKQPEGKCAPNPSDWSDPVWQKLEFHVDDPSHYQYSFEGDGTTFTITAIGDPLCDGHTETRKATGKIGPGGVPETTLAELQK